MVVVQVEVLENIVFTFKKCVSAFFSIIERGGGFVVVVFLFFSRFKWIK